MPDLTQQEKNFCTDVINLGAKIVALQPELVNLAARYNLNQFTAANIANVDLAAVASLSHLTEDKLFAAFTGFNELLAALGDPNVAGTNMARFIELQG